MEVKQLVLSKSITDNWIRLDPTKVVAILIHHPEASKASPEDINQWHLENGWSGIGYNEYIRKDGTVYICRGMNIGAQCQSWNSKTYGVCCEGNYEIETMPEVQLYALVARLRTLKDQFPNLQEVAPHSKYYPTSCPGKNFPLAMMLQILGDELFGGLRTLVQKGILGSPAYWVANAVTGQLVKCSYLQILVMNTVANLTGVRTDITSAINQLVALKIISSPTYWLNAVRTNQDVRGDFVAILIKNITSKMR